MTPQKSGSESERRAAEPAAADELLPLPHLSFQVLLALAARELHGYGIVKEIERRDGRRPSTGSLYLAIQRLEREGLVEPAPAAEREVDDDEDSRRRYYRLTEPGRAVARAEAARLAELVADARARDLLTGRS